jgi:hypothetical protein
MELPATAERQLYLITRDETIMKTDPESKLHDAFLLHNKCRLRAAKAMKRECLYDVPFDARERFLQLLQAVPHTAGITKRVV